MKKILIIIIVLISVVMIYIGCINKKINYLSLGDFLVTENDSYYDYINNYLQSKDMLNSSINYADNNKRSIDLINDIEKNIEIEGKTIQNRITKADVITLSIGMNDIFSNIQFSNDFGKNDMYKKAEKVLLDLENLFKLMRLYSKENIIFIGYYNNDKNFNNYLDNNLEILCKKYNIDFINISNKINNYLENNNKITKKIQNNIIFEEIKPIIDKKIYKNT